MSFSYMEMWKAMGLIPKVLVIGMLLMSVYTLALVIERAIMLIRIRRDSTNFADMMEQESTSLDAARVIDMAADPQRGKYCFLAQAVLKALQEAESLYAQGQRPAVIMEAATDTVSRSVVLMVGAMRKRLVLLASTASGAPFLGLFATIMGLISSFQNIAVTESGGIAAVSAGIAEALIGTLIGLFVAIPALFAHNYLTDRIDNTAVELDNAAMRIVQRVLRRQLNIEEKG